MSIDRSLTALSPRTAAVAALACLLSLAGALPAKDESFIRRNYRKSEFRVPMRDGMKLFTVVYEPKEKSKKHPILLVRTPYSVRPYGKDQYLDDDNPRRRYFKERYIVVFQDVRGRYMSEGEFVHVRPYIPEKRGNLDIDESSDAWDTVDWLVRNIPSGNGRVGVTGTSYPGFYASMAAIDAHPAVKAVSPQAPVSRWMGGDDWFHHGAFLVSHAFDFLASFGRPRPAPTMETPPRFDYRMPDGYRFFLEMGPLPNANSKHLKDDIAYWNELTSQGLWSDYWQKRDVLQHFKNVRPAVAVVGGWFDTENLYGALETFAAIRSQSPATSCTLVMGPWSHGGWNQPDGQRLGDIDFHSKTADYFNDRIELPFFNRYLKEEGKPESSGARLFHTGSNEWRTMAAWPPPEARERLIHLHPDGSLKWEPPGTHPAGYREYTSDPSRPVPYTPEIVHWYNPAFMVQDQRFASRRTDVLTYQTEPLTSPVTLAGPMTASLWVSTSGTDSDWVVKLIDVFPDGEADPAQNPCKVRLGGYEMLLRGDVMRGKFRNSLSNPEPFVPGQVTRVEFELQDVYHTFRQGHRLMIQVQSTWFPMIDRNPQRFVDIFRAVESDFQAALQRVYGRPDASSCLRVLTYP